MNQLLLLLLMLSIIISMKFKFHEMHMVISIIYTPSNHNVCMLISICRVATQNVVLWHCMRFQWFNRYNELVICWKRCSRTTIENVTPLSPEQVAEADRHFNRLGGQVQVNERELSKQTKPKKRESKQTRLKTKFDPARRNARSD